MSTKTTRPSTGWTLMSVVSGPADATAAEIGMRGTLPRSTVSKIVARPATAGKGNRSVGGRDGDRQPIGLLEPRPKPTP
jgi:hypothetical protein